MTVRPAATAHRTGGRRLRWLGALAGAVTFGLVVSGCGQVPGDQAAPAPDSQIPATSSPSPSAEPTTAAPTPSATTTPPSAKPTTESSPTTAPAMLQRGDTGMKVRGLQHRLRQLDWYAGNITGTYGSGTVKGVEGFQEKRKLDQTGAVDKTTWSKPVSYTHLTLPTILLV